MIKKIYHFIAVLCLLGANCLLSPSLYANRDYSVSGRRQIARAEERKSTKSYSPVADNWENRNHAPNQNSETNQKFSTSRSWDKDYSLPHR